MHERTHIFSQFLPCQSAVLRNCWARKNRVAAEERSVREMSEESETEIQWWCCAASLVVASSVRHLICTEMSQTTGDLALSTLRPSSFLIFSIYFRWGVRFENGLNMDNWFQITYTQSNMTHVPFLLHGQTTESWKQLGISLQFTWDIRWHFHTLSKITTEKFMNKMMAFLC